MRGDSVGFFGLGATGGTVLVGRMGSSYWTEPSLRMVGIGGAA